MCNRTRIKNLLAAQRAVLIDIPMLLLTDRPSPLPACRPHRHTHACPHATPPSQDVNWDRMAGMAAVLLRDVGAGTATDVATYNTAINAVLSRLVRRLCQGQTYRHLALGCELWVWGAADVLPQTFNL